MHPGPLLLTGHVIADVIDVIDVTVVTSVQDVLTRMRERVLCTFIKVETSLFYKTRGTTGLHGTDRGKFWPPRHRLWSTRGPPVTESGTIESAGLRGFPILVRGKSMVRSGKRCFSSDV